MRAYCVSFNVETKAGDRQRKVAFTGSEVEARQMRANWMQVYDLPRKLIEVKLIDIPTTKVELLGWLNLQFTEPE